MDYFKLKAELTADPEDIGYTELTDQQAADALNVVNRVQVYSRFLSLRALAAVMSDVEYGTLKAFLSQASAASPRVADMAAMLAMPCSDAGDTGGLDFGAAEVRAMVDAFGALDGMADAAARVKALAERRVSRAEELGLGMMLPGYIASAREMT